MTDKEITEEMTRLEQKYQIPLRASELEEWLAVDPNNAVVLEQYRALSAARSI